MSTAAQKPGLKTSAMIASIAAEGQPTRAAPFGHALVELARTKPDVIGMTADLGKYTDLLDSYKSLSEALTHGGIAHKVRVRLDWVDSEVFEDGEDGAAVARRATGRPDSVTNAPQPRKGHEQFGARRVFIGVPLC